jgi:hypothetical protein
MSALTAPVFIVGQARSGSSILYRVVQEHPRFLPAGGLNLTESHVMDAVATAPDLAAVDSLRGFAGLDDRGWSALLADLQRVEARRRVLVRAPKRAVQRSVELWTALGGAATVRTYLRHAARARGAARLVEKTPNHLPWGRHLAAAFPDARLVVISRHPVAAYASFRRRAAEDAEATWADLAPAVFAARWRADVTALAGLAASAGGRLRVERYEHLVSDPDRFQRDLFRWLGEDPLTELPAAVPANPHAPASEAPQLFGTVQDLGRDWTEHVDRGDAARLEDELAAPMALLGYRPAAR